MVRALSLVVVADHPVAGEPARFVGQVRRADDTFNLLILGESQLFERDADDRVTPRSDSRVAVGPNDRRRVFSS